MKLATFQAEGGPRLGLVVDAWVVDPGVEPRWRGRWPAGLVEFIQRGEDAVGLAREVEEWAAGVLAEARGREVPALHPLREVTLLAPIPRPSKNIFCVGRNYREHVEEGAHVLWGPAKEAGEGKKGWTVELPPVPVFFTKAPTAVIGPEAPIVRPRATERLDWECELAVVIGRKGKDIPPEEVFSYVFGYTILNDITARDLQQRHGQWFKGKSCDTFCPMGPWVVLRDDLGAPPQATLVLRVNGAERQRFHTRQMIFDIPAILSSLSAGMTIEPGDIVATGTGAGCGFAMDPPQFLQPGDVVEAEIEGIGVLRNPVIAE